MSTYATRLRDASQPVTVFDMWDQRPTWLKVTTNVLRTASFAACVYHGMKRHNDSLVWGLGWGAMGALFPVISPIVAIAAKPGFAKCKYNCNPDWPHARALRGARRRKR